METMQPTFIAVPRSIPGLKGQENVLIVPTMQLCVVYALCYTLFDREYINRFETRKVDIVCQRFGDFLTFYKKSIFIKKTIWGL